jgi:hypothetical protein
MPSSLSRSVWHITAFSIIIVLIIGGAFWWSAQNDRHDLIYVVPIGTAQRLAAGEALTLFPDTITLDRTSQNTLVIRNEDTQSIQVGPYKIAPGQSFTQRFYNRGTYDLTCSLHKSEQLRIIVQ